MMGAPPGPPGGGANRKSRRRELSSLSGRSLSSPPSGIAVALAFFLVVVGAGPAAAQEESDHLGSEVCQDCHADSWETFQASTHSALELEGLGAEDAGCEACHGPGLRHVELALAEEPGFREAIVGFADEPASERAARCMSCHTEQSGQEHFGTSLHLSSGVDCSTCHDSHVDRSVHAALRDEEPRLCFDCHGDVRAQFQLTESHPVREGLGDGFMTCSDCHSPHGSTSQFSLAAAENQSCTDCHVDKEGPWVFPHPAGETDGCVVCHQPHGSVNPHLLDYREMQFNCLQCHTTQPGFHILPGFAECTACHAQIHGSNLDPFFLR